MDFTSTDGIINILKPPGMTSSNVVSDVRGLLGIKRVGHAGTLDPGAGGVLPICFGRATRLFDLLIDKQKEYIAEISFGACTDTQDSYGSVISRSDKTPCEDELKSILSSFLGEQKQTAPAYSALKVNGQAMYKLARRGEDTPKRERDIQISSIELLDITAPNRFLIKLVCSRGTYVRTICEDIGAKMGLCSHMSFLLRTRSGSFTIDKSVSIGELYEDESKLSESIVSVEEALEFLPRIDTEHEETLLNGMTVSMDSPNTGEYYRVYSSRFLGVGQALGSGLRLKLRF